MIIAALPLVLVAVIGSGIVVGEKVAKQDETAVVQTVDQSSTTQSIEELQRGYQD